MLLIESPWSVAALHTLSLTYLSKHPWSWALYGGWVISQALTVLMICSNISSPVTQCLHEAPEIACKVPCMCLLF